MIVGPSHAIRRGAAVAHTIAGAWRANPPPPPSRAPLGEVGGRLLEWGAGSLGWWRLRRSALASTAATGRLRQAYRLHTLQAARHEDNLTQVVAGLRAAGVEPILIKGWAVARLYPETGLRPYGDLDLCVRPGQLAAAVAVLTAAAGRFGPVELHEGVPDVTDRSWQTLDRRSRLAPLGGGDVRVLGPEDQLRQLCLHFWRHNACRPLWLCDIGAALESCPADFDWDYCLRGDQRLTGWVVCIVALAGRLLGARVAGPRLAGRAGALPAWLPAAVLWKWGEPRDGRPLTYYLQHPAEFPKALLYRWLDPLKASYRAGAAPRCPPVLLQLLSLIGRLVEMAARLQRHRRKRRPLPAAPFALHLQGTSRFL
jgi:hypothetical protein